MTEPLDRLESIGLRDNDSDRTTSLRRQPGAVQFVAQDHGRKIVKILKYPAGGKRAAKHLLRLVVVVAVVKHSTKIFNRLSLPDDDFERHPLPDTGS